MKVVILAGGGGTRLFPLSRACFPKQFLKIAGNPSLLQQTVKRFLGLVQAEDILIVTNKDYVFHVQADLKEIAAEAVGIITEPVGRNTAPAIALAVKYCEEKLGCNEAEVVFISPADHLLEPIDTFQKVVAEAEAVCQAKQVVMTLGVVPNKPETGYGYIQASKENCSTAFKVDSFKEKPDYATAEQYVAAGNYYWNSGMYMFSIGTIMQELAQHAPEIAAMVSRDYQHIVENFAAMPNISIDYAVSERSANMAVMPLSGVYWNDIGSFDAIAEAYGDKDGNLLQGDVLAQETKNTMVLGHERLISTIGVDNLLIVDTPDALLIAEKGKSQDVKKVVEKLKADKRKEVSENVTMFRPWGSYTILSEGPGYKVKKITVNPGAKLSLQLHYHRSEHWTVISGTGKVTLDDKVVMFKENESTFIPIATKHRLENPGKLPLSIIEVQNGKYLGEDDIVRFDDEYGRQN